MINFFRKIRKRLADQNKPLKYFRYAVGEIVLVMVGILLALQVNNWNENRKDQSELRNIFQNILQDMKGNQFYLEQGRKICVRDNKRIKTFLNYDDYTGFDRDSLEKGLETEFIHPPWRWTGYRSLQDSGITEYGKYAEAAEVVNYYYEFHIKWHEEYELRLEKRVSKMDEFWRFRQDAYEFNYVEGLRTLQNDETALVVLNRLLKSPTPRNILKIHYRSQEALIERYDDIEEFHNIALEILEGALKENG
jgi:hypothetical protein